jgi:type II secretory pathway pseudopilin PulG
MADNGSSKPSRDVDDISLDDARPAGKPRRGSAVLVVVVLLVLVAVVAVLYVNQQKAAAAKKEAEARAETARAAQMESVKRNLQAAYDLAAAGNVEGAIDKLAVADSQLGNIVSAANSEGNSEAATQALNQKKYIADALSALQTKKQELQTLAMEQFTGLQSQFGLQAPTTTAPTTETAPPATTDGTTPPATGTEPAPTAAPAATPEAPAAPAAPVAPVAPAAAPVPGAPAAPAAPVAPPPPGPQ